MAKYTEASCRLCRAKGEKLFIKGDRCYSSKCAVSKRGTRPGMHVEQPKLTEHAIQLREKQKLKNIYGLLEAQFYRYYTEASSKKGVTGDLLIQFLERRLDNVVYRLGFGSSRKLARQLVRHGHILVNGKKVDIPSYRIDIGDVITVKPKTKSIKAIKESVEKAVAPSWLNLKKDVMEGSVVALVTSKEEVEYAVNIELIIAFYSK